MAPLILLLTSYTIFFLTNYFFLKKRFSISFIGRTSLAFMLLFTGIAHFTKTNEMIAMLPSILPAKGLLVYITGIIELIGVIGLLSGKISRYTSIVLIVFFICVLPANIVGSLKRVALGGMENGPSYLFFRIPLQLLYIGWTYYFGIKINRKK